MPDESVPFDDLIEEFYSVWCRYHPAEALTAGDPRIQGLLPALGDDEFGALQSWLESFMVGLEELDAEALDSDRRLDLEIAFGAASIEHHDLLEHDWRHRDPLTFLPLRPLMPLLTAVPAERRSALLEQILPDIPSLLRQAQAHLARFGPLVSPLLTQAAMEEGVRALAYLDYLRAGGGCTSQEEHSALPHLLDEAHEAVRGYRRFLQHELLPVAQGNPGCGEARFQRLMRHQHGCTLPLEALRTHLDRWRAEYALSPEDATPSPGEAAPAASQADRCREEMERLRRMAAELQWLPRTEAVPHVAAWPGIPLVAGLVGDTLWLGDEAVSWGRLRVLCLDYGPLGEFLFRRMAGKAALSWPRRLYPAAALHGAWGLFLRDKLMAAGQFEEEENSLHRQRLAQALEEAQLDLDIHLGGKSEAGGLERLRHAGWDEAGARERLVEIIRHPADATATVLGWHMLAAVAGDLDDGAAERLRALLQAGQVPLPLAVRNAFGSEAAARLLTGEAL